MRADEEMTQLFFLRTTAPHPKKFTGKSSGLARTQSRLKLTEVGRRCATPGVPHIRGHLTRWLLSPDCPPPPREHAEREPHPRNAQRGCGLRGLLEPCSPFLRTVRLAEGLVSLPQLSDFPHLGDHAQLWQETQLVTRTEVYELTGKSEVKWCTNSWGAEK